MNPISHFLAAYLIGRKLNLTRGKLFLITFFGIISDFDVPFFYILLGFKNPSFYHAGITHTLIFGLLAAIIATVIAIIIELRKKKENVSVKYFLMFFSIAMLGFIIHISLDVITVANEYASLHHLYFWPLWNFSFHIEYMFPLSHAVIWTFQFAINFFIIGFLLQDYFIYKKRSWNLIFHVDEGRTHKKLDIFFIIALLIFYAFWQVSLSLKILGLETFDIVNFILGIVT